VAPVEQVVLDQGRSRTGTRALRLLEDANGEYEVDEMTSGGWMVIYHMFIVRTI
jgi:hypothetical protein